MGGRDEVKAFEMTEIEKRDGAASTVTLVLAATSFITIAFAVVYFLMTSCSREDPRVQDSINRLMSGGSARHMRITKQLRDAIKQATPESLAIPNLVVLEAWEFQGKGYVNVKWICDRPIVYGLRIHMADGKIEDLLIEAECLKGINREWKSLLVYEAIFHTTEEISQEVWDAIISEKSVKGTLLANGAEASNTKEFYLVSLSEFNGGVPTGPSNFTESEEEAAEAVQDSPVIQKHIGMIGSVDIDEQATFDYEDEEGETVFVFDLKGSKGTGVLVVSWMENDDGSEFIRWAKLRLTGNPEELDVLVEGTSPDEE